MATNEDLLPLYIMGAEGDDDPQTPANADGGDDSQDTNEEPGKGSEPSSGDNHDDADDPKVKGLKSALEKERLAAKAREAELKELRKIKKAQDQRELEEKSEIEQAQIREQKAAEKAEKLARGFLNARLNAAIEKAAAKQNFLDVDDALAGVDRESISIEQDEDDPSVVTIDDRSVENAVKKLAARKPHFLKTGTSDGGPTGGQFGGSNKKTKTTAEQLKEQYPGL